LEAARLLTESLLAGLNLAGKILVDCTNPVGLGLTHGLESRTSGAEDVQRLAPGARAKALFCRSTASPVKTFSLHGPVFFDAMD